MGLEMAESGGRLHCKSEARHGRAHPVVVAQSIGGARAHDRSARAAAAAKSTPHAGRGSAARRAAGDRCNAGPLGWSFVHRATAVAGTWAQDASAVSTAD